MHGTVLSHELCCVVGKRGVIATDREEAGRRAVSHADAEGEFDGDDELSEIQVTSRRCALRLRRALVIAPTDVLPLILSVLLAER